MNVTLCYISYNKQLIIKQDLIIYLYTWNKIWIHNNTRYKKKKKYLNIYYTKKKKTQIIRIIKRVIFCLYND